MTQAHAPYLMKQARNSGFAKRGARIAPVDSQHGVRHITIEAGGEGTVGNLARECVEAFEDAIGCIGIRCEGPAVFGEKNRTDFELDESSLRTERGDNDEAFGFKW